MRKRVALALGSLAVFLIWVISGVAAGSASSATDPTEPAPAPIAAVSADCGSPGFAYISGSAPFDGSFTLYDANDPLNYTVSKSARKGEFIFLTGPDQEFGSQVRLVLVGKPRAPEDDDATAPVRPVVITTIDSDLRYCSANDVVYSMN